MSKQFVVVDEDGHVSCDDEGDPQDFDNFAAAQARASELAKITPDVSIKIFQAVSFAVVTTNPPIVGEIDDD